MSQRISHEQLAACDEQGERHLVQVVRAPVPGAPHLHGPPRYSWNAGQALHLVDARAGILQCSQTGRRLTIVDWRP